MAQVRGIVTRWLDDHVPGFVEFVLTDVDDVTHVFHDKVPELTLESLLPTSTYPRELWVEADVLNRAHDSATVRLWDDGIESHAGNTKFTLPLLSVRADDEPVGGSSEPQRAARGVSLTVGPGGKLTWPKRPEQSGDDGSVILRESDDDPALLHEEWIVRWFDAYVAMKNVVADTSGGPYSCPCCGARDSARTRRV